MSAPLWTFDEVVQATQARVDGDGAPDLSSVSIDSRTIEPGALFVAIRGDNLDGHDYVAKAFEAGAGAALVAEDAKLEGAGLLLRVPDTLKALEKIGQAARNRSHAKVIAITGSVGKTGSKEALRLALEPTGAVHASQKSYNNHWGVPLTLANFPRDAAFGVFEVGMNHPGEITPLTKMIRPHVAIVTTVEPVHLEFFESVADIAEAKAEIFDGLEPGGTAILNRDNPHFDLLKQRASEAGAGRIIGFGENAGAEARLMSLTEGVEGSQVEADICGTTRYFLVGVPGRHVVWNALGVLAAVDVVGGDMAAATDALAHYRAQAGRGARETIKTRGGSVQLIDESYNANPASMRAALSSMSSAAEAGNGRLVAVLGDMLELGATSAKLHEELAEPIDAADLDIVFACGPHMRSLYDALPESRRGAYAEGSEGLVQPLTEMIRAGDVVMVKGSLGSRMALLVEALRSHLSQPVPGSD